MTQALTETITMSPREAYGLVRALDLLTRLGLGQMDCVEHAIRDEIFLMTPPGGFREADHVTCDRARHLMVTFQNGLGFQANASYGIFSKNVCDEAHRAWEVKKVLDKALSEDRDPNPTFRGVNYDGISVRCTNDPVPGVALSHDGDEATLTGVTLHLTAEQAEAVKLAVQVATKLTQGEYDILPDLVEQGVIPYNDEPHMGCYKADLAFFKELARALTGEMTSPLRNRDAALRAERGLVLPAL